MKGQGLDRLVLGAVLGLALAGVGMFWWQGRAQVEEAAPPPPEPTETATEPTLPQVDPADLTGPAPPQATELTREQRRFFRYDRNRDLKITRNEMLSTRSDAFRKLDKDGNNLLTFEEWAVTTATRFDGADADGDRALTQAEFATTAPRRKTSKPRCNC
ncbi:EF-hand domain-containing protein [Citromicrobium bathyomarinum]|uniref:EF-hand domain-containing protein n=1 Tax=Citromicrobium bathyomarinum TaxID=72174 RepID=UPI00315A2FD2